MSYGTIKLLSVSFTLYQRPPIQNSLTMKSAGYNEGQNNKVS